MDILSTTSRVQVPVIIVKIGQYTFGHYDRVKAQVEKYGKLYFDTKVTFPNYVKSLSINKVNGAINRYTLELEYAITQDDDPNMLDKVFSSVSRTRKIEFSYGDATIPDYMYRNEEALITKVRSRVDMSGNKKIYTVEAVSTCFKANAVKKSFPAITDKPSNVIRSLLRDRTTGLIDVFYGMHDLTTVEKNHIIPTNDREVYIPRITTDVLSYLKYLVTYMSNINDLADSTNKKIRYTLVVSDTIDENFDGPYFSIREVYTSAPDEDTSVDVYTIDIGYPSKDLIVDFSVSDDQSYSILFDFSEQINTNNYVYRIDDDGSYVREYSPSLTNSTTTLQTTDRERTYWSDMTQFPIKATLRIRGLLRAIMLMSYIRVNVYFFGKKDNSSGLYIVTRQDDSINDSGYQTTLSLTRIGSSEFEG